MGSSAEEQRLVAQLGVQTSWANTEDRSARTAKARAAMWQKFLDQAGGDPVRADHLRKAHIARLRLKALKARRQAKEVRLLIEAADAEEELEQLGGEGK
jgi:hypothetical protein